MILEFFHTIFSIIKVFFGLGALAGLVAIGFLIVWYALRVITMTLLRGQAASRFVPLRKLFLDL